MEEKINIREFLSKGFFHIHFIIEIAGRPENYVKESLNLVFQGVENNEKIKLIDKKIHDVTPLENIFSGFIEVEALLKNFQAIMELIIDYMPSSLEIIEPKDVKFNLNEANIFINDLIARLHNYDSMLQKSNIESGILKKQLQHLLTQIKLGKGDEIKKELEELEKNIKKE